jgi:hypothetical protein
VATQNIIDVIVEYFLPNDEKQLVPFAPFDAMMGTRISIKSFEDAVHDL